MSDKLNESLSALMDGELDELALHRLLGKLDEEPELKKTWARYHAQQDAIKGELSEFAMLDISASVSASIADAPLIQVQAEQAKKPWYKAVAGLSVAASVAFAVVLGARFNPLMQETEAQFAGKTQIQFVTPEITRTLGPTMVAQTNGAQTGEALEGVDEKALIQAQERLNTYLLQHAQDSALGQGRTVMPFARVVNFNSNGNQGSKAK